MRKLLFLLMGIGLLVSCSGQQPEVAVRCATFNIRYDNPGDSLNAWSYRKDSVCRFIKEADLEVIGMQEVLFRQTEDLKAALPAFDMVGVGRDDGHTLGEYSPIFYRKDKFELLDSQTFWLSQYPDSVGFIGWDGACTRIATWAKLKDVVTGKIFMFVNTHFDHVGTQARREAALLIIDRIKQIAGKYPAILTGDLNVTDSSEAYLTLTTNEFVLKDAHKIAGVREGVEYTFHGFGRVPVAERSKIDFVLVTPSIQVSKSFIPGIVEHAVTYLSDHNPQVVDLKF